MVMPRIVDERGYPLPGFLDWFTRRDELEIQQIELLKQLMSSLNGGKPLAGGPTALLSLADQRRISESGQWVPYTIKSFSLTTARTDFEVIVEGDFIHAWTDGSYAGIGIRYNNTNNDLVYFQRRNPVYGFRFWKLYLTHTAQSGMTLDLMIGREAAAYADSGAGSSLFPQLTAIDKASQHGVAETLNTDILATSLSPTNTPCLFRVMVMLETSGVFSAILTNSASSKTLKFNGGAALAASCPYMFDILVHSGDTVNFQTSASGNVTLRVQEVVGAVQ